MISFDHRVKIFYKDIDQMGIVYYSRYFEYFEEARTELLSSIGLGVTDVEKKGIMLPVISSHCDYLKGARFEQNIIIRAGIFTEARSKLQIDYSVFIEDEKEPIATGYTEHAFVNDKGLAVRAPKMILKRLNQNT